MWSTDGQTDRHYQNNIHPLLRRRAERKKNTSFCICHLDFNENDPTLNQEEGDLPRQVGINQQIYHVKHKCCMHSMLKSIIYTLFHYTSVISYSIQKYEMLKL
jgi:hypothetical protein